MVHKELRRVTACIRLVIRDIIITATWRDTEPSSEITETSQDHRERCRRVGKFFSGTEQALSTRER